MKKFFALVIVSVVVFVSLVIAPVFASNAVTYDVTSDCVPKDAYTETIEHPEVSHEETRIVVDVEAYDETVFDHWQRYSWTGGPHESDNPPAFPSEDWQPNVQGDPHGIGVAGAYFRSHGNSGNGDWFYLEAVNTVIHHDAETHEETFTVVDSEAWVEVIDHPAVTCEEPELTCEDPQYVPIGDECETEEPPVVCKVDCDPDVTTVTRTVHTYTCTAHVATTSEKANGKWSVVDRVVDKHKNTCLPGKTPEESFREEGL